MSVGSQGTSRDSLQKKQWIELKPKEAHDKLANFIAINPEEVIMPVEAERLIKEVEALRPRVKVHAFPYSRRRLDWRLAPLQYVPDLSARIVTRFR